MDNPTYYGWKSDYSLGIESIDAEHERLFLTVKILHRYIGEGASRNMLKFLFGEVVRRSKAHFEHEEKFMKENLFPDDLLENHIKDHKRLLSEVGFLEVRFDKKEKILVLELFSNP